MDFSNLLISTIMNAWGALAQGVLLGIGLVLLVKIVLALAAPANACTRFAIWFTTLLAVAVLPPVLFMREAMTDIPIPAFNATRSVEGRFAPATLEVMRQAAPAPPPPIASPLPHNPWLMNFKVHLDTVGVVLFLYAFTVSLLLLRLLLSYYRLRRLKNKALIAPPEIAERFESWLKMCRTNRPVRLLLSSKARSPMAAGFNPPAVILPDSLLLRLTAAELDHVGLHELAHLRRNDDWTNLCQKIIQAVFFFHPAVYWINRKLDFEREVACDDWVLTITGQARPYARSLTKVLELSPWRSGPVLASGAVFRKRQIIRRIEMLLDGSRDSKPRISQVTFVVILMCLFGAFTQIMQMPEFVAFGADRGSNRHRWQTDGRSIEFQTSGDVIFGDDDASIKSVAPGGFLSISERRGWTSRKVEAREGAGGQTELRYFVDSRERPLDAAARDWMAAIIPQVIRETGFNAEERVARILQKRGASGVFEEVDRISSDHVRRIYLSAVIQPGKLNADELRRAMDRVRKIPSDHDKANLLMEVAQIYESAGLRSAYFEAVNTIGSDHDRRRVLTKILAESGTDSALIAEAGRSIEKIGSDHDKAEILKLAADRIADVDLEARRALLRAVDSINSDHDKARVITSMLEGSNLTPELRADLVRVAEKIGSDHEKSNLMAKLSLDPATPGFADAVRSIQSDHDKRRVLEAMVRQPASPEVILQVVAIAASLSSDNDKAEVLKQVAERHGADADVREAVRTAAETIQSDSEYRRVVSKLMQHTARRSMPEKEPRPSRPDRVPSAPPNTGVSP